MFKNAEYRLSLQQSLGGFGDADSVAQQFLLSGASDTPETTTAAAEENEEIDPLKGKVKGKIRVRYGPKDDNDDKKRLQRRS